MKMLKVTLMVAVAAAAMLGTEAAPANKMKLKMAEMLVKNAEDKAARFKTGTMVKTSTHSFTPAVLPAAGPGACFIQSR